VRGEDHRRNGCGKEKAVGVQIIVPKAFFRFSEGGNMTDGANENAPKIDRVKLAGELCCKAEGHLALARDWHKKRSHANSLREAIDSIECSTQVMRLLFDMDFEHEPPGSAWFGQLMEGMARKSVDDKTANLFKRIGTDVFHATKRTLNEVIEESIS